MDKNDDIVARHKRLRFTRKELHVLLLVLDSHLQDEEDDGVLRAGHSALHKLRFALQRLIAKEKNDE